MALVELKLAIFLYPCDRTVLVVRSPDKTISLTSDRLAQGFLTLVIVVGSAPVKPVISLETRELSVIGTYGIARSEIKNTFSFYYDFE
ncbi:MAG: hypothetical protein NPIRA03_33380 [Nitrospirales bacterium]|nr:MAG: hypothetical protein NPIRA03_33380 [Nitrospirales bacterium]